MELRKVLNDIEYRLISGDLEKENLDAAFQSSFHKPLSSSQISQANRDSPVRKDVSGP